MVRKTRARKISGDSEPESDPEVEDSNNDVPASAMKSTIPSSKMFIIPKCIEDLEWKNMTTITLPHPQSGNPALFLVDTRVEGSSNAQFLFEILTFEQPLRSWFVDDNVVSDGNLRVVTQIDPLFLVLPIIKKSSQARPLSDHLCDDLPPQISEIICHRLTEQQLENISTKKRVDEDLIVYVYSEEATLSWLAKKVEKTAAFLTQRNITRSEASISSNFSFGFAVKQDENEYLRYGCDIIGDYLEDDLKKKLLTKVGLPAEPDRKRKSEGIVGEHGSKKSKVTAEETKTNVKPLEDYGSNSTPTPPKEMITKAKKDLVKAAQGTPSLFKFFAPKAKSKD